jgi:hypothetical protein
MVHEEIRQAKETKMKLLRANRTIVAIGAVAAVAAWSPVVHAATPEERARCVEMMKRMGLDAPHDHGRDKTGAPGPMTAEHVRCQQILGDSANEHKDGNKHDKK